METHIQKVIELKNISKIYKVTDEEKTVAVDNVSLIINKGEFAAIMGHQAQENQVLCTLSACLIPQLLALIFLVEKM